jgi:hypothetical protein
VVGNGGSALRLFTAEIVELAQQPDLPYGSELAAATVRLEQTSDWLLEQAPLDANLVGSACVEYLQLFGYVAYAYMWSRMAHAARNSPNHAQSFFQAKQATAEFFFARLLPRIDSLENCIRAGSGALFRLEADQF